MDLFDTTMIVATAIYSPLLLFFWVWLLAMIGHPLYIATCNLGRAHSLVEARTIDQRQISPAFTADA